MDSRSGKQLVNNINWGGVKETAMMVVDLKTNKQTLGWGKGNSVDGGGL